MGAFSGLSAYFDRPLAEYAAELGYDPDNVLVLEGNLERLQREHPQTYQNLLSCRHHSDRRTPLEYGQDLVASWLFEDHFLQELQAAGLNVQLAGADRQRKILANQRTSASSDFLVASPGGQQRRMELMNDYTGFWYRTEKLHLRDQKYNQLCREQCLMLALSLTGAAQKYALFDFSRQVPAAYLASHRPYGGKPAYELSIPRGTLLDFTPENVKQQLLQVL